MKYAKRRRRMEDDFTMLIKLILSEPKSRVKIIQGVIIKLEIDVHLLVTWEKREKGSKNQRIPKRLPNT